MANFLKVLRKKFPENYEQGAEAEKVFVRWREWDEIICKDTVIKGQLRDYGSVWLELKVGWREMREYHGRFSNLFIKYISSRYPGHARNLARCRCYKNRTGGVPELEL